MKFSHDIPKIPINIPNFRNIVIDFLDECF